MKLLFFHSDQQMFDFAYFLTISRTLAFKLNRLKEECRDMNVNERHIPDLNAASLTGVVLRGEKRLSAVRHRQRLAGPN